MCIADNFTSVKIATSMDEQLSVQVKKEPGSVQVPPTQVSGQ